MKPFVSESLSHNNPIIVNNDNIDTIPLLQLVFTMSEFVVSVALILSHLFAQAFAIVDVFHLVFS